MTRRPRRAVGRRPGVRTTLTAAAAAVIVLGAVSAVRPTVAAWTDSAHVAVAASAGTWTTQPPSTPANSVIVPGSPTTSISTINWSVAPQPDSNLGFCVSLTVTGTTPQPTPWELRVDLDKPPFNGVEWSRVDYSGNNQVNRRPASGDATTLVVTGMSQPSGPWNAQYNNALLSSSQTLTVGLCVSTAGIPDVGQPSWYSTSASRGEWSDTKACKILTVKGKVSDLTANPFYFTWVATLDLTDAKQRIQGAGKTPDWVDWSPVWPDASRDTFTSNPPGNKPVPDSYALTGGRRTAIRGTSEVTVRACVIGY